MRVIDRLGAIDPTAEAGNSTQSDTGVSFRPGLPVMDEMNRNKGTGGDFPFSITGFVQDKNNWWVWVVALLIIAALVYFFIIKKKKK